MHLERLPTALQEVSRFAIDWRFLSTTLDTYVLPIGAKELDIVHLLGWYHLDKGKRKSLVRLPRIQHINLLGGECKGSSVPE